MRVGLSHESSRDCTCSYFVKIGHISKTERSNTINIVKVVIYTLVVKYTFSRVTQYAWVSNMEINQSLSFDFFYHICTRVFYAVFSFQFQSKFPPHVNNHFYRRWLGHLNQTQTDLWSCIPCTYWPYIDQFINVF